MCLGVDLFEFIPLGIELALWMCRLMFFIKLAKFWSLLFPIFFSFSSFSSGIPIMHMLVCLVEEAMLSA